MNELSLTYEEMVAIVSEIKPLLTLKNCVWCKSIGDDQWILGFDQGYTSRYSKFGLEAEAKAPAVQLQQEDQYCNIDPLAAIEPRGFGSAPRSNFESREVFKLLISIKKHLQRFHLVEGRHYGTPAHFENSIQNVRLESIELLNEDRILQLKFENGCRIIVEFFSKNPKLSFLKQNEHYAFPEKPARKTLSAPISLTSEMLENRYTALIFEQKKSEVQSDLIKILKRINESLKKALDELERCQGWQKIEHLGKLLQANVYQFKEGMSEIVVSDWEENGKEVVIPLIQKSFKKTLEAHFKDARKRKKGIAFAEKALKKAEQDLQHYQKIFDLLQNCSTDEELLAIKNKLPIKQVKTAGIKQAKEVKPYREFLSASGMKILVGKKAKDNEMLTFKIAKGNDYWLHVKDYGGSHVVICCLGKEPDPETVLDAAHLALYYSQAKGDAEVTVTEKKHISRIKGGKTGQVAVSKSRTLFIRRDEARIEKIRYSSCSENR